MSLLIVLFSLLSYGLFLGTFIYLVIFVSGGIFTEWLPILAPLKTIDSGQSRFTVPDLTAIASNLVILLSFGLQHSVMARKSFKKALTRIVPEAAERSVFVLATSFVLCWIYIAWQPVTGSVWHVEGLGKILLSILFLLGTALVLWATFMINHWELFGLAQAWRNFSRQEASKFEFKEPALYKFSRHPLYLGLIIVFWATPVMTTGHLLFASVWTAYVFIGIGYEEKDMIDTFGNCYVDYMKRVPQLFPFVRRK